jgi:hypothetical protein
VGVVTKSEENCVMSNLFIFFTKYDKNEHSKKDETGGVLSAVGGGNT